MSGIQFTEDEKSEINFGGFIAVLPYLLLIPFGLLHGIVENDLVCVFGGEWREPLRDRVGWYCDPVPEWFAIPLALTFVASWLIIWPIHAKYSAKSSEFWKL
tara:strand:- start:10555 stop:10860 length:306 start_codon:yes stop_codon:yes gene_type:complete